MARVSMGDVWDDAKGFVAREAALLLPLGLATLGAAAVLLGLIAPTFQQAQTATVPPGTMLGLMAVLLMVLAVMLTGQLAISALVLVPGGSVGEALGEAVRRLPGAMLASFVMGATLLVLLVLTALLARLITLGVGGSADQAGAIASGFGTVAILWLFVRLIVLVPLIATTPPTLRVARPIRAALALTRRRAGGIAAAALVFLLGYALIVAALEYGVGALLLLAGRAVGAPEAAATIARVIVLLAGAVIQIFFAVFQATLYRRLRDAA